MKVLITGGNGLVGSAIKKIFTSSGFSVLAPNSSELDLLDREAVFQYFSSNREIDIVIHAAARVGGILGNKKYPATFIGENLRIQTNVFDAASMYAVARLIFIASSCIYSPTSPLPLREANLFSGKFEESNRWYAIAKSAGIMQVEAIRLQFGLEWFSVLPTNIYGPNDNFAPTVGHVMPSLIKKFYDAKRSNAKFVTIWGTGLPYREFIYVEDLAMALMKIVNTKFSLPKPYVMNIGSGFEIRIKELAELISKLCDFNGKIIFDSNLPDGVLQKTLDSSVIRSLGWEPRITIENGIKLTLNWIHDNYSNLRSDDLSTVESLINIGKD